MLKVTRVKVYQTEFGPFKIETSEVDGVEQAIIHVRYDDVTIHLNSENELELRPDEDEGKKYLYFIQTLHQIIIPMYKLFTMP